MKTIKQISVEHHLNRSTLLKAAQRGTFADAATQSGTIWLVDDSSQLFLSWLTGSKTGRPRKTTSQESRRT
jgi:hypothetical protein